MNRKEAQNSLQTHSSNAKMAEAVNKLLNERDGLALGICNGFQALIKLGLVPYGEIRQTDSRFTDTDLQYDRPSYFKDGIHESGQPTNPRGWHRQSLARRICESGISRRRTFRGTEGVDR